MITNYQLSSLTRGNAKACPDLGRLHEELFTITRRRQFCLRILVAFLFFQFQVINSVVKKLRHRMFLKMSASLLSPDTLFILFYAHR